MKRNPIRLNLVTVMVLAALLYPAQTRAVESLKGTWSLGIYSALNHSEIETAEPETYESDSIVFNGSLGYFLTDHIELNLSGTYAGNETEGAELNLFNYYGSAMYNFYSDGWQAIPYVGLQLGRTTLEIKYEDESYSDTSYSFGFMGGLKVFLSENLSLDIEYNWLYTPKVLSDLTMTTIFTGFTWYFGGE